MAIVKVRFQSSYLKRNVSFSAIIPTINIENTVEDTSEDTTRRGSGFKTLYMLHGYSGDCNDYLGVPEIQELSDKYKFACILPNGENSFYLEDFDKSENFSAFIGKELVEVTRSMFRLSRRREDTFIGGISMGGYGAMINGLRYPDTFAKIISLSGAYIGINIADKGEFIPDQVSDAKYQRRILGNPKELRFTTKDPRHCMEVLKTSMKKLPEIYFVCGKDDFLIESNRKLHNFMVINDVVHYYEEGEGVHDWVYWRAHIESSILWALRIL